MNLFSFDYLSKLYFRMNSFVIYGIGFIAQILFFGRTILQWFKSEHEGEVISPVMFWKISILASIMMLFYGIFRKDFAIVLGQILVYYIYVRNLQLKNAWEILPTPQKIIVLISPVIILLWLLISKSFNFFTIFRNDEVSIILLIWGTFGQIVFTFRFIYQWLYSEKEKESVLPVGFWIISLTGSSMILIYSIFRTDPVLFIAHITGIFIYLRNILLSFRKSSLFSRFDLPFLHSFAKKLSDRID